MLEIIDVKSKKPKNCIEWRYEDTFFSNYAHMKKPTFEKAKSFGIETVFHKEPVFGIHNCWNYKNDDNEHLYPVIDGLKLLQSLQKVQKK